MGKSVALLAGLLPERGISDPSTVKWLAVGCCVAVFLAMLAIINGWWAEARMKRLEIRISHLEAEARLLSEGPTVVAGSKDQEERQEPKEAHP